MSTTAVVIPTLGKAPELWPLLDVLRTEPETVVIVEDNGMDPAAELRLAGRALLNCSLAPVDAKNLGLYAMWNDGARLAIEAFGPDCTVAFLNDDIALLPGSLGAMREVLHSDPGISLVCANYNRRLDEGLAFAGWELVSGTYRTGGICGWCFMVRADRWPGVDESFEVWFGDDDLVCSIEDAGGKLAIALGVPVDHVGEATVATLDWTHDAKVRDRERFIAKWPGR